MSKTVKKEKNLTKQNLPNNEMEIFRELILSSRIPKFKMELNIRNRYKDKILKKYGPKFYLKIKVPFNVEQN